MQALPKVELHLHLDCSLSFEAVHRIDPEFTHERYLREIVAPRKVTDLSAYLARTRASVALLQTEAALRIAVADLFRQLAADNVIYAEIRFAPLLHMQRGLSPENVVRVVLDATNRAVHATGIEARLILCALRHFTPLQSMVTARLVDRYQETRVAALDLAGDEAGFPLDAHLPAFKYAIERDLPRTVHAGEAAGPESVWEVLTRLKPQRIGHGVHAIEDPALLKVLRKRHIHLEVCPTCNVQIDLYHALADHPLDRLYRAGVSLSVNTDARGTTPTTLSQDYEQIAQTFGWGLAEFYAANVQAMRAAFAPAMLKRALIRRLKDAYTMAMA